MSSAKALTVQAKSAKDVKNAQDINALEDGKRHTKAHIIGHPRKSKLIKGDPLRRSKEEWLESHGLYVKMSRSSPSEARYETATALSKEKAEKEAGVKSSDVVNDDHPLWPKLGEDRATWCETDTTDMKRQSIIRLLGILSWLNRQKARNLIGVPYFGKELRLTEVMCGLSDTELGPVLSKYNFDSKCSNGDMTLVQKFYWIADKMIAPSHTDYANVHPQKKWVVTLERALDVWRQNFSCRCPKWIVKRYCPTPRFERAIPRYQKRSQNCATCWPTKTLPKNQHPTHASPQQDY